MVANFSRRFPHRGGFSSVHNPREHTPCDASPMFQAGQDDLPAPHEAGSAGRGDNLFKEMAL